MSSSQILNVAYSKFHKPHLQFNWHDFMNHKKTLDLNIRDTADCLQMLVLLFKLRQGYNTVR